MSDKVEQWLKQIGLVKYLDLFRENDIEWDILPHLDAETLKEIGVTSAGHRIRILNTARAIPPQAAETKTGSTEQREEAERRQVTVMFSDLVGSTELSQLLDPEDLREVMRAYQDACKGGIEKFEGFVARYMGDGVLSYFGYPKAQEDAAERAVLSGLAIIDAVKELDASLGRKNDIELKVRIGIATGPVVAGDIIGEGASLEQSVVGETPNLAARLQALATPGTVAIADETQALVSSRIESVDLGVHSLKGIARPVRAWRAVAPVNAQARFNARAENLLTDFHGRDGEIDALLRCWRLARSGNGQVVLISGEPGIGKSRTVETFRTRISTDGRANVRLHGSVN